MRRRLMITNGFSSALVIVTAVSLILVGCATIFGDIGSIVRKAPLSKGISETFIADYDEVIEAARKVILTSLYSEHRTERQLDARTWIIIGEDCPTSPYEPPHWHCVRVVVKKISDTETTVHVYGKKTGWKTSSAKEDSQTILFRIRRTLEVGGSGLELRNFKKLPATADNTVFVASLRLPKLAYANLTNTETVRRNMALWKSSF